MTGEVTSGRMVIAVDGSAASDAAVRWGAAEAALRKVAISLVHVNSAGLARLLPKSSKPYAAATQQLEHEAQKILDSAAALVAETGGANTPPVERHVHTGHPVGVLVEQSTHADMVVVGFRGHGRFGTNLLGPVSEGVIRHAHCPVAVVRARPQRDVALNAPVVVGVDGSAPSARAAAVAFEEAQLRGVPLVAVHAWSDQPVSWLGGVDQPDIDSEGMKTLEDVLSPWRTQHPGVEVRTVAVVDRPSAELLAQSEHAQLVVVGSHGRGGFAGMMLGSVSSSVVQGADIPVIVAR
jgi:nucleotide-binding universal stress UspA family protein